MGANGLPRDEAVELLRENEQLNHAMESRPVIDMARGVLMARLACEPEEAWEILVTVSQHANIKLRDVAKAVTSAATGNRSEAFARKFSAALARDHGLSRRAIHTAVADLLPEPTAPQGGKRATDDE